MTTTELAKLREATNRAIRIVQACDNRLGGAKDWGDLHCAQAAWVSTDEGDTYAEVTIEDVAPEASDFRSAIASQLAGYGYGNVLVVTEW